MTEGIADILSIIQPETPSAGGDAWQLLPLRGLSDEDLASAGL